MRTLCALSKLQLAEELEEDILHIICDFIAEVYSFRGPLAEARWLALRKNSAASLAPPTEAAATQHISNGLSFKLRFGRKR